MQEPDPRHYHQLYGIKAPRISFQGKDFIDYTLMILISVFLINVSYGFNHLISKLGVILCAFMVVSFLIRHGFKLRMPIILKRPQDVLYLIVYKIQGITPYYLAALGLLFIEYYLVILTPNLPHKTELMSQIAVYLFYAHFIFISGYRTIILVAHLRKKELVREVLIQSSWKNLILKQPSMVFEIIHAYFTGVLTHIILIAPWYLVITHFKFSVIFLPVAFVINIVIEIKFTKILNAWFYREHWLGHNSELDFLYLHGTHHDAIPSGLIGVAGNGYLEGFTRHTLGWPKQFFNPVVSFILYTVEIFQDIYGHQFIPGVFPYVNKDSQLHNQHSTHHYGRLEPYGFAENSDEKSDLGAESKIVSLIFPDELKYSIKLDEQLTGFKWNNPRYRWYVELCDKYQK